jgi:elongation factor Tu
MFRMVVSDVFFITGRGAVATGKPESGVVRVGDEVQINGAGGTRVDGIEAFREVLEEARAGDNVGLLFKSLDKGDVGAGDVITAAGGAGGSAEQLPDIGIT